MRGPGRFWNDLERSQKVQQRLKQLQNKISRQEKLITEWQDLTALCEMGQEADDAELLEELKTGFDQLESRLEEARLTTLLSGEYDNHNAILTFHAGAGGTEAQDWARCSTGCTPAGRSGMTLPIRSWITRTATGRASSPRPSPSRRERYGLLKSENGVHRWCGSPPSTPTPGADLLCRSGT